MKVWCKECYRPFLVGGLEVPLSALPKLVRANCPCGAHYEFVLGVASLNMVGVR